MVLDYYKLPEQPFGVTPDSRYLFLTATHREALASLIYGIEAGCGFVALIAGPGLGKTTLLFHALNLLREKAKIVFLFQTVCTPMDLLRVLLTGLGVRETLGNRVEMQLRLQEVLAEQYRLGNRVVVVFDEAQNLDDSVLELVRMLSNFETSREKLIQIILSGQPQLAEKIGSPDLVQLRQRVSIVVRLQPLSAEETALYIRHRVRTAGCGFDTPLFTKDALALIAQCSEGIPRNINTLCFNALSLGCALQLKMINCDIVREVVANLDLGPWRKKISLRPRPERKRAHEALSWLSAASVSSMLAGRRPKLAVAMAVLLALGGALFASYRSATPNAAVQPPPKAAVQPPPMAAMQPPPKAPAQPAPTVEVQPDLTASLQSPPTAIVQANRVVQPLVPAAPSASSADRSPQPGAPAGEIRVAPGQTLLGICVKNFGSCNTKLLQEIHGLNPWLNSFDHIESGQTIRIPVAGATQSIADQPGKAPLVEKGTHE